MTLRNNSSSNRLLVTYWQWCNWFSHVQLQCKYSPRSWSPWGARKSPLLGKWIQCICQSKSLQLWGEKSQLHVTIPVTCTVNRNTHSLPPHTDALFFLGKKMHLSLLFLPGMEQQRGIWVKLTPSRSPWCWITSTSLPRWAKSWAWHVGRHALKGSILAAWSGTVQKTGGSKHPLEAVCFVMLILLILTWQKIEYINPKFCSSPTEVNSTTC